MHPHPERDFFHRHRLVAVTIAILVGGGLCLADSMPAKTPPSSAVQIELKADRRVGLAPMSLEVSGTLRDADRTTVPLAEGEHAELRVASSYLRLGGAGHDAPMISTETAEFGESLSHEDPMKRTLLIQRPGTYTLRWLIEDADGNRIWSNEIQVRVL